MVFLPVNALEISNANDLAKKLPRLDKRAWIAAAFAELAAHGWDGVRVEPIAATLGVTKGSFYWHFADRDALVGAMFIRWAEGRVRAIRERNHRRRGRARPALPADRSLRARPEHAGPCHRALRSAVSRAPIAAPPMRSRWSTENGLRAWLRSLAKLGSKESEAKAFLFYAFVFGQSLIAGRRDASLCRPLPR